MAFFVLVDKSCVFRSLIVFCEVRTTVSSNLHGKCRITLETTTSIAEHTFRREMSLAVRMQGGFRSLFRRDQMTSESPSRNRKLIEATALSLSLSVFILRIELKPVPCCGREYLKRAVLLQTFVCPHCFDHYTRPLAVLGRWPLVNWLLKKPWVSSGKPNLRNLLQSTPRFLARSVRRVRSDHDAMGSRCMDTIRSGIRRIMAIFNKS